MHSTNYRNTLITVSPDTSADQAHIPDRPGTIAALQYALLANHPYAMTSDDLIFEVHAIRSGIDEAKRQEARTQFFSRGQACLRSSPLVKQFGWGIHHDDSGRIALVAIGSPEYEALLERSDVSVVSGMRSKRA